MLERSRFQRRAVASVLAVLVTQSQQFQTNFGRPKRRGSVASPQAVPQDWDGRPRKIALSRAVSPGYDSPVDAREVSSSSSSSDLNRRINELCQSDRIDQAMELLETTEQEVATTSTDVASSSDLPTASTYSTILCALAARSDSDSTPIVLDQMEQLLESMKTPCDDKW